MLEGFIVCVHSAAEYSKIMRFLGEVSFENV